MRLSVVGCGYLGATHAACMAELGHDVVGVEVDRSRLSRLEAGDLPFFEPRLPELLRRNVAAGRLCFTSDVSEAAGADVHFLCVGTPQLGDALGADLSQVHGAVAALAPHLTRPALVVGKSTVPVGTARGLADALRRDAPAGAAVELAWNPEFLREGFAVQDTLEPDRLVFGVRSPAAEERLRDVYATPIDVGTPVITTTLETAEMSKLAANAFLATKISFINAVAEMCEVSGADVVSLADTLGFDTRIGRRFLNAGVGFGGGCLPKDIRAFQHRAGELGVEDMMGLLDDVDRINQRRRERAVQVAAQLLGGRLGGARVAVLGAAFKPESDDVRDSPALWIAGQLQLSGAAVRVHDPQAMSNARDRFPTLEYADSVADACHRADLVMLLTEWQQFRKLTPEDLEDLVARRCIFDGRNVLDPQAWRAAGWTYHGVGRP
jgi:UDPglucose 6-dehydrogenase